MSAGAAQRGLAALALVALAVATGLALTGCERRQPGVQAEELRIVARWIEDVAHGIPRRPGELELDGASAELRKVARWASGDDRDGVRTPPLQLRARLARHPGVAGALRSSVLLLDGKRGLVGPEPRLGGPELALAGDLADAENRDRRTIDAIVLSLSGASLTAAGWYAEAVRTARLELDGADGGRVWEAPEAPAK